MLIACIAAAGTVAAQEDPIFANVKGEVKAVLPGGIVVEDANANTWQIKPPGDLKEFSVTGTGDETFLRPGLLVRLEAFVNKKFEIEKPISSLTVITVRDVYDVGMVQAGAGEGGSLFAAPDEKKKPKKAKPKIENEAEYKIGAEIVAIGKGNKIVLNANGTNLKAELDESPKVSVDVASLEFVRVGDKVDADVVYYDTARAMGVPCESRKLTIKAAAPFAADAGKKKAGKAPKKTPVKKKPKAKADEEENEKSDNAKDDKKSDAKKDDAKKDDAEEKDD
jgi:hypothetical protein